MKKTYLTSALTIVLALGFNACSGDTNEDNEEVANNTEVVDEQEEQPEETDMEEESPLGNFAQIVGNWTVDAATAGVKMDLSFSEEGVFTQKMGEINQEGTWEVVDEDHLKVTTPNTKNGQTWLVSNLTESTVDICWNPDSAKPKTLPMQRVK